MGKKKASTKEEVTKEPSPQEDAEMAEDEEVKEPAKKRQKTDKTTSGSSTGKAETSAGKKEETPASKKSEEEEEEEEEEAVPDEEEELATEAEATSVVQGSTIGQLKQIKEKKPFTDSEAEQVIAEWMEKQNRPYSVQNLLDNFQHQLKRAQCMRIMDSLSESQILTCKEYGKAKVYTINQDCFPQTNPEQLKMLDDQMQVRKEELDGLQANLVLVKNTLKESTVGATNSCITEELNSVRKEIEALKLQLQPFKTSGATMLTEKDLMKAEGDLKKWQLEWKKRKRGCMDVVNSISESMEMNRKDFLKKVGLETDEENKVVCPL